MANQPIPTTDSVEDRTVEKVVLSGSSFISSMYGGGHLVTPPLAPLHYTNPWIWGEGFPESVLTCEPGSFNSSPRAVITYQWQSFDGVLSDIPGETNKTYTVATGDIGNTISCAVTITNASGFNTVHAVGILILERQAQDHYEMDVYAVGGWSTPRRVDVMDQVFSVVSGIAHNDKTEVNGEEIYAVVGVANDDALYIEEADLYNIEGSAADLRSDINTEEVMPIQGMAQDVKDDTYQVEVNAITGWADDDTMRSFENEVYAMFHPVHLNDLVVLNGDAENAVMTDWTMDSGNVQSVTTATGSSTVNREGLRFFKADSLGLGVDSQMSQVIAIPAPDLTDIDTGLCYSLVRVIHDSDTGLDHIEITLEALNAALGVIGTATHVFASNVTSEAWEEDNSLDNILSIPTLTRHIKITVLFKAHDTLGGPDNNGYLDDIRLELMKTA